MAINLGIDTGGTFTDGVVINTDTNEVLAKSKATTTKEDLSIGIANCIEQLDLSSLPYAISFVCLSTTLATNSVVEGKVSRVGLITSNSRDLKEIFMVDEWRKVSGKIELTGEVIEIVDENDVVSALKSMKGKVDSLVISGYACVRNPEHELLIKNIANRILPIPIVCAHELSSSLGFNERTMTAVLNAHLLPVIDDLVKKTKTALAKKNIKADIAIVKGDGTMMPESYARQRPVETVLSGPAASVVGAVHLTEEKDAFVVDLGGTTMDIANMCDGNVSITEEGATIDGRKTKVKAIDIHTFGLGGDSRLNLISGKPFFGPQRAIPLCYAVEKNPYLLDEITSKVKHPVVRGFHAVEGLMLNTGFVFEYLSELEMKIAGLLKDGPHSIVYLSERLDRAECSVGVESLIKKNIVQTISITPTDLLHATGDYVMWNQRASDLGIDILAETLNISREALLEMLIYTFTDQMSFALMKSAFAFENNYHSNILEDEWLFKAFCQRQAAVRFSGILRKKIIALGAPAKAWLTRLSETLRTDVVLPEHSEVANAVGAARGEIHNKIEVLIRYDQKRDMYHIHLPWKMATIKGYSEAQNYAIKQVDAYISEMVVQLGISDYNKTVDEKKWYLTSETEEDDDAIYEAEITVMVSGRPECIR